MFIILEVLLLKKKKKAVPGYQEHALNCYFSHLRCLLMPMSLAMSFSIFSIL